MRSVSTPRGMKRPQPQKTGGTCGTLEHGLQRISLLRWVPLTLARHPFAGATHRCVRDGIPGSRLPGSTVYPRFRPLRTSRRPGGDAVTPAPGGRDLHPHGELSDKAFGFAIFPRTEVLFRSTGRTYTGGELPRLT